MQKNDIGSIERSRTREQFEAMQEAIIQDKCPFCDPEKLKASIIKEGTYWTVKYNDFPYQHHRHHILIILKKHTCEGDVSVITPEAWLEFGELAQWTVKEFRMKGGGITMRFGDPDYNAGTIRHLHAHIQEPDLTGPAGVTFAKDLDPKEEKRRQERLDSFQK